MNSVEGQITALSQVYYELKLKMKALEKSEPSVDKPEYSGCLASAQKSIEQAIKALDRARVIEKKRGRFRK